MDDDKPIGAPVLPDKPVEKPESFQEIKKKLNWKGFFIAIIIVIIIEVFAVTSLHMENITSPKTTEIKPTHQLSPTINSTNWIKYTSRDKTYSFSYPSTWITRQIKDSLYEAKISSSKTATIAAITIQEDTHYHPAGYSLPVENVTIKEKAITLDTFPAEEYAVNFEVTPLKEFPLGRPVIEITVRANKNFYDIQLLDFSEKATFDQILSTFKFKKPTPPLNPTPAPTEYYSTHPCPSDVQACPDGSFVGRQKPLCEFPACPAKR